jgi:phenylalanyl-tRNA synthetase beta chain
LQTLLDGLKGQTSGLVQDVQLFDVYAGKGVPENKKSLAFRIVMQDTQRTLQDSEVDAACSNWCPVWSRHSELNCVPEGKNN